MRQINFVFDNHDKTTFGFSDSNNSMDVEVGDAKKKRFYPRIKLLKWNNEANFSIGLADTNGVYKKSKQKITFQANEVKAIFEPVFSQREPDKSAIRYVNLDRVSPVRISSLYELDRWHKWSRQTITVCRPNQLVIGYFGVFPKTQYVDPALVDIPECRMSSYSSYPTDPMAGDDTMWLIDVHYDVRRDNVKKMKKAMVKAICSVLEGYGVKGITHKKDSFKLYFNDHGKDVKFLSSGFFDGHYFLYVNLGFDYHLAHKYLRKDLTPPTKDKYAYGLRSVSDIPDKSIEEIVQQYAKNYGLPLKRDHYSAAEEQTLKYLDNILCSKDWIDNAIRDDVHKIDAFEGEENGANMDFELISKPSSNEIALTLRSKNLLYYRQEEDARPGFIVSPRVVGSYAVYHAEGKEHGYYKTGKAFHIYRPWAEDANKNRVWCKLHIPTNKRGELIGTNATITLPQEFIDSASYPIYIDPTFGFEGNGALSVDIIHPIGNVIVTPNNNIGVTALAAYLGKEQNDADSLTSWYYRIAMYASSGGIIRQTVIGSNSSKAVATSLEIKDLSVVPTPVAANSKIILCVAGNSKTDENGGYDSPVVVAYDQVADYPYATFPQYSYPEPTVEFPTPALPSGQGGTAMNAPWTYATGAKFSIYAIYDTAITISPETTSKSGVKILPVGFP